MQPVLVLAVGTAALSAGVGYLPVLGARHHLGPLATGVLVSLLAATAALIQPWAGRAHDHSTLPIAAGPSALLLAAAGFLIAVIVPNALGIASAAILIGAGIGISTPLGFAGLAASAPKSRIGQTMGAGEVGRELGDAGGPILVGAFSPIGLAAGLLALATAITAGAITSWTLTRSIRHAPAHEQALGTPSGGSTPPGQQRARSARTAAPSLERTAAEHLDLLYARPAGRCLGSWLEPDRAGQVMLLSFRRIGRAC